MMAVTEGVYTLPSGRSPQLVGILPDIEAYSDPAVTKEEDSSALREEDLYMNPYLRSNRTTHHLIFTRHEKPGSVWRRIPARASNMKRTVKPGNPPITNCC